MKITFNGEKNTELKFRCGDYFKNTFDGLRQIVETPDNKYAIIDPEDGESMGFVESTVQDVVKTYVKCHGQIHRVIVKEIIAEYTGEVLKK